MTAGGPMSSDDPEMIQHLGYNEHLPRGVMVVDTLICKKNCMHPVPCRQPWTGRRLAQQWGTSRHDQGGWCYLWFRQWHLHRGNGLQRDICPQTGSRLCWKILGRNQTPWGWYVQVWWDWIWKGTFWKDMPVVSPEKTRLGSRTLCNTKWTHMMTAPCSSLTGGSCWINSWRLRHTFRKC